VSLLTRKTWSLPSSDAHLLLHVLWWRHYYHFLRPHQALGQRTPAMVLGLTDHVWSIHEFVTTPLIL
jgi:transposase InsO family protein